MKTVRLSGEKKGDFLEMTIWPSEYRSMADALELQDEEGRGKLRKAGVRSTHPSDPRISEWGNPHTAGYALQRLNI